METEEVNQQVFKVIVASLVLVVMAGFILLTVVSFVKKKRDLLKEKAMLKANYEQTLLQTQLEIQEQTLRTISQEIHDNIGQVLSLAKLNLAAITGIDKGQERLTATRDLVSKAITDLRDLSKSLNADRIRDTGLVAAIQHELHQLEKTGQFTTSFTHEADITFLSDAQTVILFRIIQETLNNIMKHAEATHIAVAITSAKQQLMITINDNGKGFDRSAARHGLGLQNIINRAAVIQATATIDSVVNEGTTVTITLNTPL